MNGYYAITARVTRQDADGWHSGYDLPTFYLHSHVQGIFDEAGAERIARLMIQGVVDCADGDVDAIHVTAVHVGGADDQVCRDADDECFGDVVANLCFRHRQ